MNNQLKNQSYQLTHNGSLIADLTFDERGNSTLAPGFRPEAVRLFLAVMTLIVGEFPIASDTPPIIIDVTPGVGPLRPPPKLKG